jgi:hypothetical protein
MNKRFSTSIHLAIVAGATLTLVIERAKAEPLPQKKPIIAQTPMVQSNAIPQSVFVIPSNPKQGRDPFFPESGRFASTGSSTNAKPVSTTSLAALILQGISGSPDHRLAIINGRTLAEGEETEISIGNARVHFRCVEIKEDTVVIEMGSERRELRFRPRL